MGPERFTTLRSFFLRGSFAFCRQVNKNIPSHALQLAIRRWLSQLQSRLAT